MWYRISNWLFRIFHPSYWIMVHPYSAEWDAELLHLMEVYEFEKGTQYDAMLGDRRIWIANHPYGSFLPHQGTPWLPTHIRPACRTVHAARKKYLKDTV